ncbi:MAG TPA: hypothetical protein VMF60_08405, partial [Acidimicrobiales bacterium]|nr:hypothetical protein [Acidimicrobiales bacterium]
VNVTQQLGAALGLAVLVTAFGLAVLVTAFGAISRHVQLGGRAATGSLARVHALMVDGLDGVFAIGIVFTVVALVLIAGLVRAAHPAEAPTSDAAVAEEAGEWLAEYPVPKAG